MRACKYVYGERKRERERERERVSEHVEKAFKLSSSTYPSMTSFTFYLMSLALPRSLLLFLIIYINWRMERLRVAVGSTSNKENRE